MVTAGVYMIARMNFFFAMAPATLHVDRRHRRGDRAVRRDHRADAKRHQESARLLDRQPARLHVPRRRRRRVTPPAIFHLMTHAFFKACLFLGSGSVIHAMHHEQDMRKMGGLKQWMPITFATFFISVLAIAGLPAFRRLSSRRTRFSGWRSLERALAASGLVRRSCGAGMTAFYMFRQVFMTFYGELPRRSSHPGASARIARQ